MSRYLMMLLFLSTILITSQLFTMNLQSAEMTSNPLNPNLTTETLHRDEEAIDSDLEHADDSKVPTLTQPTLKSAVENAGDVLVIIEGENLQEPVTAQVGNVELLSVTLETPDTLYAIVPVSELEQDVYTITVQSGEETLDLPNAFTVTEAVEETQFRAMVYLSCDNNLETRCRELFNELEEAMLDNANLRILAFWDGQNENDSAYYVVQPDDSPHWAGYTDEVNRFPLGEVDSAYTGTVTQFAAWAQSQFPGQYTFLSLVGHGDGWAPDVYPGQPQNYEWGNNGVGGMLWDDEAKKAMATIELAEALAWITQTSPLNVIYFDACLMSSVEVMAELGPYADYIVAHENLTWAVYPYDKYFEGVDGNTTPHELTEQIAQAYYDELPDEGHPAQIGVIDTSALDEVFAKLNTLSEALLEAYLAEPLAMRPIIKQILNNTTHLDNHYSDEWLLNTEDSAIDMYHFADLLEAEPAFPNSIDIPAQDLMDAIETAVVSSHLRSGRPWPVESDQSIWWDLSEHHGLSLYFPLFDEWKRGFYGVTDLPHFSEATAWDNFIQAWYQGITPPPPPVITLSIDSPTEAEISDTVWVPVLIESASSDDDIRGVQFSLLTNDSTILAPAGDEVPMMDELFPEDSFHHVVSTSNGWEFLLTAPLAPTEAISGTGTIVQLPFNARAGGCVQLSFGDHILVDSEAQEIEHYFVNGNQVCVGDEATLTGTALLESREIGQHDGIVVSLDGVQAQGYEEYTLPNGGYAFNEILQDTYTIIYTYQYFLSSWKTITVDNPNSTVSSVVLCAGDMDSEGDIDQRDQAILASGIVNVNFLPFDLNGDGEVNVADQLILDSNIGKSAPTDCGSEELLTDMRGARPNQRTPVVRQAEREVVQSKQTETVDFILRFTNVSGVIDAVGIKFKLPTGVTVSNTQLLSGFENAFVASEENEDKLSIIFAPAEGANLSEDSDVMRLQVSGANATDIDELEIEAIQQVGWTGDVEVIEQTTFELYLPSIQR